MFWVLTVIQKHHSVEIQEFFQHSGMWQHFWKINSIKNVILQVKIKYGQNFKFPHSEMGENFMPKPFTSQREHKRKAAFAFTANQPPKFN